jgi:hypothetical protein
MTLTIDNAERFNEILTSANQLWATVHPDQNQCELSISAKDESPIDQIKELSTLYPDVTFFAQLIFMSNNFSEKSHITVKNGVDDFSGLEPSYHTICNHHPWWPEDDEFHRLHSMTERAKELCRRLDQVKQNPDGTFYIDWTDECVVMRVVDQDLRATFVKGKNFLMLDFVERAHQSSADKWEVVDYRGVEDDIAPETFN